MGYWINIHHPRAKNESRSDQFIVCVQEKSRPELSKIPKGDLVFIYETAALSGKTVQTEDSSGRRTVQLGQGLKSVIGLVRVGQYHLQKWEWNDDISFIGTYDCKEVETKRESIPLAEIDKERVKAGLSKFNPRIPGGLRPLSKKEFDIMADLIGFEGNDNAKAWSEREVWDTTDSYMSMLKCQLNQQEYSKADFRKELLTKLNQRTQSAVEYKYQNISTILAEIGHPYIEGYQPHYGHYQKLLKDIVIRYISDNKLLSSTIVRAIGRRPLKPAEVTSISEIIVDPPPRRPGLDKRQTNALGRGVAGTDYAKQEAANRKLGQRGEEFALDVEKIRLQALNRADLAERVEWVTRVKGDGLGYDIQSWDENGNKLFIEVKTTNQGKYFPFLVSVNEIEISKKLSDSFRIYRVFNYSSQPQLYILSGPITKACNLCPITFKARL